MIIFLPPAILYQNNSTHENDTCLLNAGDLTLENVTCRASDGDKGIVYNADNGVLEFKGVNYLQ